VRLGRDAGVGIEITKLNKWDIKTRRGHRSPWALFDLTWTIFKLHSDFRFVRNVIGERAISVRSCLPFRLRQRSDFTSLEITGAYLSALFSRISIYSSRRAAISLCFTGCLFWKLCKSTFQRKKKKRVGRVFSSRMTYEFFSLVGIRNRILKLELHQFQNKRLRTANANNGW